MCTLVTLGGAYNIYRGGSSLQIKMDSDDWWESSKDDLRAMDVCYNQQLYGISAYHCQQALEKAVKSAALSLNLNIDPKKYGHDVLCSLLERTVKKVTSKKQKRSISKEQKEFLLRTVEICRAVNGTIEIDTDENAKEIIAAKEYFWGNSLKIKVSNTKYEQFVNETKKPMDESSQKRLTARVVANKHRIKDPGQRLLFWSQPHIVTILSITPHEEYGRYPGSLCGRTRKEWYRRKHNTLHQLECNVKCAINDLNENVRDNVK